MLKSCHGCDYLSMSKFKSIKLCHRKWKIDCCRSAIINRIQVHDSLKRCAKYESGIRTTVGCWALMSLWGMIGQLDGQLISTHILFDPKRAGQKIKWIQIRNGNAFFLNIFEMYLQPTISQSFCLTHWPVGDVELILISEHWLSPWALLVKWLSGECYRTPMMINQHWFVIAWYCEQQAISRAIVKPDLWWHMASMS